MIIVADLVKNTLLEIKPNKWSTL